MNRWSTFGLSLIACGVALTLCAQALRATQSKDKGKTETFGEIFSLKNDTKVAIVTLGHDGCKFVVVTATPDTSGGTTTQTGVGIEMLHHPCCDNPKHMPPPK